MERTFLFVCLLCILPVTLGDQLDCCKKKRVGDIAYSLVDDNKDETKPYNCKDGCIYEANNSTFCFKDGGEHTSKCLLESGGEDRCKKDKCTSVDDCGDGCTECKFDSGHSLGTCRASKIKVPVVRVRCLNGSCEEGQKNTKIAMLNSTSNLLLSLNPSQLTTFIDASNRSGLVLPRRCNGTFLKECNDKREMTTCFSGGLTNFSECVEGFCTYCGSALTSLLGLGDNNQNMVRLISSKSSNMENFGNLLSTPHDLHIDTTFKTQLYMNYYGALLPIKTTNQLTISLSEHYSYFAAKYNWEQPGTIVEDNLDVANTVIESAKGIGKLIDQVKDVVLGNLEKEINEIKLDIDGIKDKQRQEIEDSKTALFQAKNFIDQTRGSLGALAKETITRVDEMTHYLDLVRDDFSSEKISKFLKFQAKKMAELVDRSLTLLKEAHAGYEKIEDKLSTIKAKLDAFTSYVEDLSNKKSAAFEERKKTIREDVYIPCCVASLGLLCIPGVGPCYVAVESAIDDWEDALNGLKASLANNEKITGKLEAELDGTLKFMGDELKLITDWQGALIKVSEIDWTFPEAEIFGFSEVKPEVIKDLNHLKDAANNYLKHHGNPTRN